MSACFKLYSGAASDGAVYIDLPVSGNIKSVHWAVGLVAGAGGVGQISPELSRSPVNQVLTNNPRGVVSQANVYTGAASTGVCINQDHMVNEPVRVGERLYLNCAGNTGNVSLLCVECFLCVE